VAEAEHQLDDGHAVSGEDRPTNDWPQTGSVEFRNVTIRYDPQGPDILKDVNLSFAAGERVAIVGRTGSGKSTVCTSPIS
jgi:ABC-type bacteriocin/lantibiotic exporter with double-glycine peptidase domain